LPKEKVDLTKKTRTNSEVVKIINIIVLEYIIDFINKGMLMKDVAIINSATTTPE
jgi:hypothetical protein